MRTKRNRSTKTIRDMVRDTYLSKDDLIYPLFIKEGTNIYEPIKAMPGQFVYSIDQLSLIIEPLLKLNLTKVLLFGIPLHKDELASQAYASNGIIQQAIIYLKQHYPTLYIITDVCFCEYTSHGHCGILNEDLKIDNDLSNTYLAKIALSHVLAGCDMVAPSDKQDNSIKSIRKALDDNDFIDIPIMAYSSKFASSFYGPFREAADSGFSFDDRNYYQLDYRNKKASIHQSEVEYHQGADILMVKPASHYLDILYQLSINFPLPIATYQVSGEYAMIKFASIANAINEQAIVMESMYAFKRAGASLIITYFALDVASYLDNE